MRRNLAAVITSFDRVNTPWASDDELRADLSSPDALTPHSIIQRLLLVPISICCCNS